jgi:hypothetical protein
MQPYQEASEEIQRQGLAPHRALKQGAAIATSAVTGGLALNKVIPFLSKHIPQDLAMKGLSKIDPRFGKFISGALSSGHGWDEISNFIKEETGAKEEKQPPEKRGVIAQYSPELANYMKEQIDKGITPLNAGVEAYRKKEFKDAIMKMSKDHKAQWTDIVEAEYGGSQQALPQQQTQGQPQQQQGQPGGGQQALMAMLQKINQARGGG